MSEFDTLKNMLDRNGAKYVEFKDGENRLAIAIPAYDKEVLLLYFDNEDKCDWVDADDDWQEWLDEIKENPFKPSRILHNINIEAI